MCTLRVLLWNPGREVLVAQLSYLHIAEAKVLLPIVSHTLAPVLLLPCSQCWAHCLRQHYRYHCSPSPVHNHSHYGLCHFNLDWECSELCSMLQILAPTWKAEGICSYTNSRWVGCRIWSPGSPGTMPCLAYVLLFFRDDPPNWHFNWIDLYR
jgi:hypothetical protein